MKKVLWIYKTKMMNIGKYDATFIQQVNTPRHNIVRGNP